MVPQGVVLGPISFTNFFLTSRHSSSSRTQVQMLHQTEQFYLLIDIVLFHVRYERCCKIEGQQTQQSDWHNTTSNKRKLQFNCTMFWIHVQYLKCAPNKSQNGWKQRFGNALRDRPRKLVAPPLFHEFIYVSANVVLSSACSK